MTVWYKHLHWHARVGTPTVLLLHHLEKVFEGQGHIPRLLFGSKSGTLEKMKQTPPQRAMVQPTFLIAAFLAICLRKLHAAPFLNVESRCWKPLLTLTTAPQAWPLR